MSDNPKIPGPSQGYIEILNNSTQARLDDSSTKPEKYFPLRPSSAGKCGRELAYELMEYRGKVQYKKGPRTPESDRIFKLGHSVEYHLLKQFEEAFNSTEPKIEIRYKQQVLSFFRLPKAELIEGSIDATFICPQSGAVVDFKSKKDKFAQSYKTDWAGTGEKLAKTPGVVEFAQDCFYIDDLKPFLKTIDAFWAMNFYQLNMYFFDEYKFLNDRGIDHAVLIYYNKNDSRLREIRFRPSKEVYDDVKSKFHKVQDAVDTHSNPELVERDYILGSMKCAFCSFAESTCWKQNTLKPYFRTLDTRFPKDTTWMNQEDFEVLETLYKTFSEIDQTVSKLEPAEMALIKELNRLRVNKVRFEDGKIFEVKQLKTGGVAGGPRQVLRPSKI